jgi:signal transduction histidine kinase/CheY-like chemotaxis protein
MLDFIQKLFSSDFMPHGMCYLWDPGVLWLSVISDILIALAYYAIPVLLFRFARQRRDIPFKGIFVAFGLFILACGTTHVMGAVTVWHPLYRLEGIIKLITAVASIATFVMLLPMLPTLLTLPSPSALERVNRKLELEIEERRAAEGEVRRMNEELEERVARRTEERRSLEDQLIQSQKMEAVGRLAGGVAHDFNNLLTVILGYNDLLREQAGNDVEAAEYVQEIQRAAERASALTNQLLTFSRRQVAVLREIDLNQVVRQIDKLLRRIIGEDIELEIHLDPELPHVKVDPSHMDQVIMNLAINSRDAMPEGGRLTIETRPVTLTDEDPRRHIGVLPGRYVMLAVRDTGVGMTAATRARVFEPFFTTKEKGKGTGLGLSIVYGIVKQNHGEILVYSEPGHGTVFKIYLPAIETQSDLTDLEAEPPKMEPAQETVLVVEDEEQVRSLARTMLARAGYRVIEAPTGADALRLAAEFREPIHLLLTDVVMPGMNGVDLATQLTAARPSLRVLYMSGYTDNAIVKQSGLSADVPFLQKPFTSAGLHTKVREALK